MSKQRRGKQQILPTECTAKVDDGPKYSIAAKLPSKQLVLGVSPGPAAYMALPPKIAPKVSFGDKMGLEFNSKEYMRPKKADVPGPGQHISGLKCNMILKHVTKFSKDRKLNRNMILNRNPGAGQYQIGFQGDATSSLNPKWSFSAANRLDQNKYLKSSQIPGPGKYDNQKIPYDASKIGTGMGYGEARGDKKISKNAANEAPGPGTYNPALPVDTPLYSMGRPPIGQKGQKKSQNPGPAHYTAQNPNFVASSWSMASKSSPLVGDKLVTPAPNAYKMASALNPGLRYTMGIRTKMTHVTVNDTPGPGRYHQDMNDQYLLPQIRTFGTSGRSTLGITRDQMSFPGPSQYFEPQNYQQKYYYDEYYDLQGKKQKQRLLKLPKNEGPFVTFTKARRNKNLESTNDPGPASYNIPSSIGALPKYLKNRKLASPATKLGPSSERVNTQVTT